MKFFTSLSVIGCLLGLTAVSYAGQIASPAIYGGFDQEVAQCFIHNLGSSPISVDAHIYDESGNALSGNTSCLAPLQAGEICSVAVFPIPNGVAFACSASVSGSTKKVRGAMTLLDDDRILVRSVELR